MQSKAQQGRSYHHGDLRQALLEATVEAAGEGGLDAITLRSVAARVGVSGAAPYHHFENKADLLAAGAALAFERLGTAISAGAEKAKIEGREPILGVAEAYVRFGLSSPGEYQLLFGRHVVDLSLDTREEVRAAGRLSIEGGLGPLAEALERRGSSMSAEEAFPLLRAVLHGTVDLVHEKELGSDMSTDRAVALATVAVRALLDGLEGSHTEGDDA